MRRIKRRDFLKQSAQWTSGLALTGLVACKGERRMERDGMMVRLPMPIQIVIDDVGWWSGEDGNKQQEPYRSGIGRNHVPADYQAIVDLGKALNSRPQAATILCEWDRENILCKLPTSTWMQEKWDNRKWVGPWLDEAAEIIRNNRRHYELTLHGVGHEYWQDGKFTRAEWADRSGRMRPLDQVELHLDYFNRLLEQNQLGPFPKSFVPTAFLHTFGPSEGHNVSMAEVVKKRGISYINTPFSNMFNAQSVQYGIFGMDSGVITVDRGEDLFDWNITGGKPAAPIKGPTCGLHWPNLLHTNPDRNSEIVAGWVEYLSQYNESIDNFLAPDSVFFQQQLVHRNCTDLSVKELFIDMDFNKTRAIPEQIAGKQFILKIKHGSPLRFKGKNIKVISESNVPADKNFLYTMMLERLPGEMNARIEVVKAV